MVNLTIIIPHFNSVKTLEKLIESIPVKPDIQIIVIDDKSNKDPSEFLSENNLNRILLLDNKEKKKGAGVCRNIGLQNADGRWILFADADDFFVEGFYEAVSHFFNSDNDVVFFYTNSIISETNKESDRHFPINKILVNYLEIGDEKSELDLRYKLGGPISKLIRADFIKQHQITFDEVVASNDIMFSAKVGFYMEKFSVSQDIIYCITRSKTNLTMQTNEVLFESRLKAFIDKYQYLRNNLDANSFRQLKLHGWFFVFYSMRYGFGFIKTLKVYRKLQKNSVKMWDWRYFNPILVFKRLNRHYKMHLREKKYINRDNE